MSSYLRNCAESRLKLAVSGRRSCDRSNEHSTEEVRIYFLSSEIQLRVRYFQ
jgi:hypothetical protein